MAEATTGGGASASLGAVDNAGLGAVESDGLKRLDAGLAQTITQARSLGDVFHEVALGILGDLAKIAIERTLIQPLSAALLGGASNGVTGAATGGGMLAGVGDLLGFAGGGRIDGPGSGTSDSILARVSSGEFVMPAAATADNLPLLEAIRTGIPRYATGGVVAPAAYGSNFAGRQAGAPAGGGRSGPTFDLRGALVTADLLRQVNDKVAAGTAQAVGISVQHTNTTVASVQRANAQTARRDLTRY